MYRDATISSYLERIGSESHLIWSPIFRRNLKENEESQMLLLFNLLSSVISLEDKMKEFGVWTTSCDSWFSVTSFFMALSERGRDGSCFWKAMEI